MPKVFISHKKEDSTSAQTIANNLSERGISCYLDVLDPHITNDGLLLTNHLRENLNNCTHLLAILSERTKQSWWVPFEIGLATEKDLPISTYMKSLSFMDFPDYLKSWPVLMNTLDLDKYISNLLKSEQTVLSESFEKNASTNRYSEAFHRNLKRELGQ